MRIEWSQQAEDRLLAIEDYIAQDDPAAAQRHVLLLVTKCNALADFPHLGRVLPEAERLTDSPAPESTHRTLRELIIKGYRVVYRVHAEHIEVVTVFEGHRRLRPTELDDD
jgi:toxin ParE1/3/4